jgi:signal transduction histidine kinase
MQPHAALGFTGENGSGKSMTPASTMSSSKSAPDRPESRTSAQGVPSAINPDAFGPDSLTAASLNPARLPAGAPPSAPASNRSALTALLFAAVLVVSFNTWLAFRSVHVLLRSEAWVQHTLQVINQVERIMSSAKDAETGNRGFLITGDENYLAPYNSAVRELPSEIDACDSLTADNPAQLRRLLDFRDVLDQRLLLLAQGIAERRAGNKDQVRLLVLSGSGKAEMDHLRRIADEMEAEEDRLLVIREADARRSSIQARLTIALASGLDLVLLVLMFRHLARERVLRLEKERVAAQLALAQAETEVKAAELQLLNEELEARVARRTAELETTNRELEAFSYSVSHDLRAPLRTIDGFSLALEEDYGTAIDAVGKDYIRRVRTGVQRMGQLIDDLLQLSRITRAELVRENFNMAEIARSVAAEIELGIASAEAATAATAAAIAPHPNQRPDARPIRFRIEDGPTAFGDPRLIRVALENLFGNAVKFSSKVAEPAVDFGWDPEAKAWFVKDNGAGFDMFYSRKLFNAFNRLHGDKDFKGSGIGLATVARVIHRHHGTIWADSAVGRGATFWFTLG